MTTAVVLEKLPVTRSGDIPESGAYKRQRIYIFPTRQGLFFTGLLLVMLVLAVNYSNSMAYVMTFLLGSLLMVSMLHTYRNLRGLIISSLAANPVFAGEQLHFPLLIDNRTGLKRIALFIAARDEKGKAKRGKSPITPLTVNLPPGKISQNNLLIETRRRGYLTPGRLKIASCYPLGMFRAWSYLDPGRTCIVYPRPAGSPQLPTATEYAAELQQGKKAGTDDFTGFKPYRHGDSIRNIDWKAFAKEQPLQVKRFSGSGTSRLILSWDHCSPTSDIERRLSQLCLWSVIAERDGFQYGLDIPGTFIDLGNGDEHLHKCLAELACYGLAKTQE